ncbi:unnamed protein product, partial [Rotaria sp. Silwood2]
MKHDQKAVKDLVAFCQEQYHDNQKELKLIQEFGRSYNPTSALW